MKNIFAIACLVFLASYASAQTVLGGSGGALQIGGNGGGGSGPTLQTNSSNNSSQSLLNFVNPSSFNGLSIAFSNPSGGTETLSISGTLNNAGLTNSSITINSTSCTLGGSCTISGGGSGTVTSVGLVLPGIFTVSGSPVTSSGNLTGTLATQSANTVFAGPTTGSAAAPTFRALVAADLPVGSSSAFGALKCGTNTTCTTGTLSLTTGNITGALGYTPAHSGANSDITSLAGLTTSLSVPQGGTGAATLTGYVYGNGTSAFTASTTIPGSAITGNIPGNAANLYGTPTLPNGTAAATQSANDNSTKLATTAYVNSPGNISPTGVTLSGSGPSTVGFPPATYSAVTTAFPCASNAGRVASISDSTTTTWGAAITGGGSNTVLAFCDGSAYTVAAK